MGKKSPGFYREAWKAIRQDVSFRIDMRKTLTNSQKGQITRYWNEIRNQTGFKPTYTFRSRSKQKLDAVKAYVAQEPGFPRLKVAYIPIPNGSGKPKIKIDKRGKVSVTTNAGESGEVSRVGYLFDNYGDVLSDEAGVVAAILKDDGGESEKFKMMCGANESGQDVSKKFLADTVKYYLETYDNTDKWFFGVIGYRFDGQASFQDYLAARKQKPKRGKHAKVAKAAKKKTRSHRR